jgi:hypothetical protein
MHWLPCGIRAERELGLDPPMIWFPAKAAGRCAAPAPFFLFLDWTPACAGVHGVQC